MSQSQSESKISSYSMNEKSVKTLHQRGDDIISIPSSSNSSAAEDDPPPKICEPIKHTRSSYDKQDTRSKAERLLYHFVKEVNIEGIREVVKRYPNDFDINAKNRSEHDLLTYSVTIGDMEVLRVVLREINPQKIETSGGLEMAVHLNKMDILLEILSFEEERDNPKKADNQKTYSNVDSQKQEKTDSENSENEHEHSPLMTAILEKRFEMIELLYESGERLPKLHFPSCTCSICKSDEEGEDSRDTERVRKRVKLLEAMGSAEWLIFMSNQDGSWDPIHESMLVKDKIEQCIKEEMEWKSEYETVLRNVAEFPRIMVSLCVDTDEVKLILGGEESSGAIYPVVRQALNGGMKDFLADPGVQFVVCQEFYGGEYGWRPRTKVEICAKSFLIFLIVTCLPLFTIILWVKNLGGEGIRDYKEPLTRFLGCAESRYWMRIGSFLVFLGLLVMVNAEQHVGGFDKDNRKHHIVLGLRGAVILYVASHILILLKGSWRNPQHFFAKCPWNQMQLITCILFCITFAVWLCEFLMYWVEESKQEETNFDSFSFDQCIKVIQGIGRISFATGLTLSVIKILRFTLLYPPFGRIQAAFSVMVKGKWKTIFLYVGLFSLSLPMASWIITGKYQFWKFTPYVVVLMLLSWISLLIFLFLQVMLTGLCWTGLTCQSEEDEGTEYKYQRTREMMRYLEDEALAPPFNLIPFFGVGGPAFTCKIDDAEERKNKYSNLLRKLFQRYFKKV